MANYFHPGIYVQEVPGARSIQGASTSVAVFVGAASAGPIDTPTLVTSWNAFTRQFGAPVWYGFMPWAVSEFFSEGGTICWVVRTDTASGKAATASLSGASINAATPGLWGNSLAVSIRNAVAGGEANQTSPIFTLDVVVDAATINGSDGKGVDPTKAPLATQLLIAYVRQNSLATTTTAGKSCYVLESFGGFTDAGAGFADRINSQSMFVRVATSPGGRPANTPTPTSLAGGTATTYDLDTSVRTVTTLQGVSLLAVPDSVALTGADGLSSPANQTGLINRTLGVCQTLTSLFYVADPPFAQDVAGIVGFKSGSGGGTALNSSYGALYYPWVWIYNPIMASMVPIPPSGPALGRYAATDATIGVFKSPAGVNDGALRTVSAVARQLTDADQDLINPNGINAVRNLINYGNVLWGARTLSQDTQWTYVSVRRLFIYVEQSLRNSLQWVVFESNSQQLWSSVTRDISAFLTTLWQQGGLFGASAAEAFFVTCDASNNPPETRRLGQLYIDIGLAPVYPAEFVIIRITQKTAGPDSGS